MLIQSFSMELGDISCIRAEREEDGFCTHDFPVTFGKSNSSLQHAVPVEKRSYITLEEIHAVPLFAFIEGKGFLRLAVVIEFCQNQRAGGGGGVTTVVQKKNLRATEGRDVWPPLWTIHAQNVSIPHRGCRREN